MDPRATTAQRIHQLLQRQLGSPVDTRRLLGEPLYARDVLLVCDALEGTTGPGLARLFRDATPRAKPPALAGKPPALAGKPPAWGADTSGFGVSRTPVDEPPRPASGGARRWLDSTGRWFSR